LVEVQPDGARWPRIPVCDARLAGGARPSTKVNRILRALQRAAGADGWSAGKRLSAGRLFSLMDKPLLNSVSPTPKTVQFSKFSPLVKGRLYWSEFLMLPQHLAWTDFIQLWRMSLF